MDDVENSVELRERIRTLKSLLIDFTVPIYIIEHNTLNFKITKSMLGSLGFENVVHFRDAESFYEIVTTQDITQIISISNLNDPNLNGVEFLKELSSQQLIGKVYPVLMSPRKIPKVSQFLANICDYEEVLKPLDRSRFKQAIYSIGIKMV